MPKTKTKRPRRGGRFTETPEPFIPARRPAPYPLPAPPDATRDAEIGPEQAPIGQRAVPWWRRIWQRKRGPA